MYRPRSSAPRGPRSLHAAAWIALALGATASRVGAWPLLAPRPISNAIAGPTDAEPAAIFYNPAALGPLRGVHLWFDEGASLQLGTITRDQGAGAQAGQSTSITSPALDGFVGVTWDLFTDRVVVGVGVLTPFNELTQYPAGSAVRYQAIWQRGATLEEVIAVGVRISSRFYLGTSANFGQSWIDYRFARDTAPAGGSAGIDAASARCGGMPCGLENPLATQDVRLRAFGWGIGFSAGLLARPADRVWLAFSYISHIFDPFGTVDQPLSSDSGAAVRGAPGSPDAGCSGGVCVGRSHVTALVPDIIYVAARIEATPSLEVEATTRWVHYGSRSALDLYTQGGTLDHIGLVDSSAAVPAQIRLDRGWRDTVAIGASVRVRVREKLRLSPSLIFESSAIDTDKASAANLDGNKLDLALTLEWRPREHLRVGAHVGGTAYFLGHAGTAFDPRAQASCVDAHYDLASCEKYIVGDALPAAAGQYTMGAIHAGFALGMDY